MESGSVVGADRREKTMSEMANALARNAWGAIGGNEKALNSILFVGDGGLPSVYPVTDFAGAVTASADLQERADAGGRKCEGFGQFAGESRRLRTPCWRELNSNWRATS